MNHSVELASQGLGFITPLTSFILVLCILFCLCLIVGLESDRADDFFLASRSLPPVKNALALCGEYISTTVLLSAVGSVALVGFDGTVLAACAVAGLGVLLRMAEPLRRTPGFTLGDVLGYRSGGSPARIAAAVTTLVVCLPITIVQLTVAGDATAYLLRLDGDTPAKICTVLLGLLIISFSAFGGMRGTTLVQICKAVFVFGAMLAVSGVVMDRFGWGFGTLLDTASLQGGDAFNQPGHLLGNSVSAQLDFFSMCLGVVLGSAVLPPVLMRVCSTASVAEARRTSRLALFMVAPLYGSLALAGLGAAALLGSPAVAQSDPQGLRALFQLSDALTAGTDDSILFTAVACAVFITALSSVASLTLVSAAAVSHDLYACLGADTEARGEREVRVARTAVMGIGATSVALAVALHEWGIMFLSTFAGAVAASTIFPALVYSLFWKRFTKTGLLWAVYGSLLCCVVLEFFSPAVSGSPLALLPERDFHWFPLQNSALVSVPVGFALGWAGSVWSASRAVGQRPGPAT
ncbi:cation acetate symporter [Streptomyces sp. C10-9-1]|uniref:sodium/solute symporter n=1 Tax=Streptomyces sp. C10-9-1 TaxID=1859285 RepID=UPI003D74F654